MLWLFRLASLVALATAYAGEAPAGDAAPGVVQGIHLSIDGIAAGRRNSG